MATVKYKQTIEAMKTTEIDQLFKDWYGPFDETRGNGMFRQNGDIA